MTTEELETRVQAAEKLGHLKINIRHASGNEGVWACFATEKDKAVYDQNKSGDVYEVYLQNHALIAEPTWGARLKLKATGNDSRSIIDVSELIKQIKAAIEVGDYHSMETFRALSKV